MFVGCGNNTVGVNSKPPENAAPNSSVAPPVSNVNLAVNSAANVQKVEKQNVGLPVTLPVLDAMFADDTFAADLKNKIQLSDEQIAKLKDVSQKSVQNLTENGDQAKNSTTASVKQAEEQIRGIIGDDKSNQLFELIQTKSAGETIAADGQKPNQIPTDTRVVVNAPAYRMDVFKDGKILKTYKIGIGYPEFPLPNSLRKAETIIFNPTWTPPDEPWVKGKVKAGQKIEAGSKMNPLGPIKIPIGSPSLIHGGKSPAKLGTFNSHGCVGLTDPEVQDFALTLAQASGTQLTADDVLNYRKEKDKTKNLKLAQTMPVELRYETIVVENGVLHIYRDVYERKTNSLAALKNVLEIYGVDYDKLNDADKKKIIAALKSMNLDGGGQPIIPNVETADAAPLSLNSVKKVDKDADGSVTRIIKGGKDIAIQLAELKGKGYPAPVSLYPAK